MRIAVTGGAGFIGSHLVERLLGDEHQVLCIDNLDPFYPATVKLANLSAVSEHPSLAMSGIDLCDANAVFGFTDLLVNHLLGGLGCDSPKTRGRNVFFFFGLFRIPGQYFSLTRNFVYFGVVFKLVNFNAAFACVAFVSRHISLTDGF